MANDRFGPVRTQETPPKRFRIDYNRLITVLMVVAIIALAVFMVYDYKRKKDTTDILYTEGMVNTGTNILVAGVNTAPPREEVRPAAEKEGFLPVFYSANISEKRVAITVDQCGGASEINKILEACAEYGAKVTFFPTTEEVSSNPGLWTAAVLGGHEIENHTRSNVRLTLMSDAEKQSEITLQTETLRAFIGEEYVPHFLRTNNLEDDEDESLHALLTGLGYYGMARWAQMTPASFESVLPGQILAYNANDAGVQALKTAMRVLSENGYEMVTLNRLFDYPENLISTENGH